jgi:transposase
VLEMLLQAFFSVRSEWQLMEIDLLFCWFAGFDVDKRVCDHSTFSENRDRLLAGEIAAKLLTAILDRPRVCRLLSNDHFSVYGPLIEAWASVKSFRLRDDGDNRGDGNGRMTHMQAPLFRCDALQEGLGYGGETLLHRQ